MEKEDEIKQIILNAKNDFSYFIKHIYPLSFKKETIVKAPHIWKWAQRIQNNKKTTTLSARKHLKSSLMYAYIMWLIFKLKEDKEWLYMSYNQTMSMYHTQKIKHLISLNPYFQGIKDLNTSSSYLDYEWNNHLFKCIPAGILTFNRGRHPDGVICDDILQDPTSELNFSIIDKITRIFMEQVMSLPKEGGEIHLVGTAQHQQDLFFKLKDNPSWDWQENKAIINELNKEVLWPELFNYERLIEIRNTEIGEKAFNKEYQCSPIWTEEAYFQRNEIMDRIDNLFQRDDPAKEWKGRLRIIAGLDIGKKMHPSHLVIFTERMSEYHMIFEMFMDNWDYSKQVDFINQLIEFYLIDELRYDDTRGELEGFRERNLINQRIWKPITFTHKTMFDMASNLSRLINQKKLTLLNRQRMINSILSVNNNLQAPESEIGHGDAFWSICLAVYKQEGIKGRIIK